MHEVDFLPVGAESKSGDAIAFRFVHPVENRWVVVVIDAGFVEVGEDLVNHIRTYFDTDTIDLLICTHRDQDHRGGMPTLLEEMNVLELMIHRPALYGYGDEICAQPPEDLVLLAQKYDTEVTQPFAGLRHFGDALTIVGPTETYFTDLLAEEAADEQRSDVSKALSSMWQAGKDLIRNALSVMPEETLTDDFGGTTPRNNSSVVISLVIDGEHLLFTGDAGVPALDAAVAFGKTIGLPARVDFFQAPHHGSKHNLSGQFLDGLFGEPSELALPFTSFISSSEKAPKHPSPKVVNALSRRGGRVFVTEGRAIWHHRGEVPPRANYSTLTPLPPLDESDDDE